MLHVTLYEDDQPLPTGWLVEKSILDVSDMALKLFSVVLQSIGYEVVFTDDPTEGVDYLEL